MEGVYLVGIDAVSLLAKAVSEYGSGVAAPPETDDDPVEGSEHNRDTSSRMDLRISTNAGY